MGRKCAMSLRLKKCPSFEITASKVSDRISLILAWFETFEAEILKCTPSRRQYGAKQAMYFECSLSGNKYILLL